MRTKSIIFVLALIAAAATANAQNFSVAWYELDEILTDLCTGGNVDPGGEPLPDGVTVLIYQDVNNNGPGAGDPLADVGTNVGQVNYNQFELNGCADVGQCGTFATLVNFTSVGVVPANPRYYLKVCGPTSTAATQVYTLTPGPADIEVTGWTCVDTTCELCGPPTPGNPFATDTTCEYVDFSWTFPLDDPITEDFVVWRDDGSIFPLDTIPYDPEDATYSYRDSTGQNNTQYTYKVKARGMCGETLVSSPPAENTGTARPFPRAPISVDASDNFCDSVVVTWSMPAGQNVDSFDVKRNGLLVGTVSGAINPRRFAHHGAPTTAGTYTVWSRTVYGCDSSSVLGNSGVALQAPPAPATCSATDNNCSMIVVTWSDVTGESGYRIFRNTVDIGGVGANITSFNDASATCGQNHTYFVRATTASCGNSANSPTDTGFRPCAPTQPTGLTASNNTICTHVALSWTSPSFEDSIRIYRDNVYIARVGVDVTTYNDATATPGTTHSYRVAGFSNACGEGTSSSTVSGVRRNVPAQVATPNATANSCVSITISWTAVAQADSYLVKRDGTIFRRVTSATTSVVDTPAAGTYNYTVQAKNACGDATDSPADPGTRLAGPTAPSNLVASESNCVAVDLTWSNVAGEDGYRVFRNGVQLVPDNVADDVTFTDNTAAPNTTYTYRVVAFSAACGNSDSSNADEGSRAPTPAQVTGLIATSTCDDVDLTWDAAANATSYDISEDGTPIGNTAGTSFSWDPGDNDPHTYTVSADNVCGNGPSSDPAQGQKLPVPALPTDLTASTNLCTGVNVSWTNPNGATNIIVYRDGLFAANVTPPTNSYLDTGASGTHDYSLRAENACGQSDETSPVSGTRLEGPTVPTGLTASDNSCDGVALNWNASTGDVDSYTIRRGPDVIATGVGTTTYTDTDAPDGANSYTVEAVSDECGGTGQSTPANGTRLALPGAVEDLEASDVYCDRVEIDWSGAPGDVDSFRISRDGTPIGSTIALVTDFTDDYDVPGTYNYTVVAFSNECGVGPTFQTTTQGTVAAPPVAASNLTASSDRCDGIFLEWTAGANLDSHQVYRDNDELIATVGPSVTSYLDAGATVAPHAYFVIAYSVACGQGDPTAVAGGERLPNPPQVQNVVATDSSCENVTVTWDAAEGNFDNYRVDRDGGFLAFVELPNTQFVDLTAAAGVTYEYMVCANDLICGLGPLSDPDDGTRQSGATVPQNLTASDDNCDNIQLAWDASTGTVDEYRIYRDGEFLVAVDDLILAYTDATVEAGVEYDYVVRAFSAACNETAPSNTATGVRLPVLGQVEGLTASNENCDGVELNWTAIIGATWYYVNRDGVFHDSTDNNTYFDMTGEGGVAYDYTVSATNICGSGPESDGASGSKPLPPVAPSTFTASTDSCFSVYLSWNDVANEDGYFVYWNGSLLDTVSAGTTTYSYFGSEVPVENWVRAFNACGMSDESPHDTGTAISGAEPPTNLAATTDRCDSVVVTWTDGAHSTLYRVTRNGATVAENIPAGTQRYAEAPAGGTYTYRVYGSNPCGEAGQPDSSLGTKLDVPAQVQNFAASQDNCDNVVLTWDDVTSETAYEIYHNAALLVSLPANSTTHTHSPLTPGNYDYSIVPINECGDGPDSDVTGRVVGTPGQVQDLAASQTRCDAVELTWTDLPDELGYYVRRDGGNPFDTLAANATIYFDDTVLPGTYSYSVQAFNNCGAGPLSEEVSGTRLDVPGPVEGFHADSGCAGNVLGWTDRNDETGYRILRDLVEIDVVAQNTVTYTDVTAPAGPHEYGIRAFNSCGDGPIAVDPMLPIPIPAAVTNLTASDTSCTQVCLAWTDVTDNTGYNIYRAGVPTPIGTAGADATAFCDNTAPGGPSQYTVVSTYVCGEGGSAGPVTGTRLAAPAVPQNVVATDNNCNNIIISWATVAGADSFVIYRDGIRVGAVPGGTLSFPDSPPPGTYSYTVSAKNECGESAQSTPDNGTRLGAPPIVPGVSATENSCTNIVITWTDVAGETGYSIYRNGTFLITRNADVVTYTDVPPEGTYLYQVRSRNQCDSSGLGTGDNGTRLVSPGTPTNVQATDDRCDSVIVTWSHPAVPGDIDFYAIYADDTDSLGQVAGTATRFATQPTVFTARSYRVRARSAECGSGTFSAANNGTRRTTPNAPTNLTAGNPVCDVVNLDWTGVTPQPDGYIITRDAATIDTVPGTQTDAQDTTLTDPNNHNYSVSAYNICGNGPASNVVQGRVLELIRVTSTVEPSYVCSTFVAITALHCPNVVRDSVWFSFNGGPFQFITTLPPQANFQVMVPFVSQPTPNCRLRIAALRGNRVDAWTSPPFQIDVCTAVGDLGEALVPEQFFLDQNYPNPFNPSTTIRFGLPTEALVQVEVFDLNGRLMGTIASGTMQAGVHSLIWDCSECPTGMYLVRLKSADTVLLRKMLLMK